MWLVFAGSLSATHLHDVDLIHFVSSRILVCIAGDERQRMIVAMWCMPAVKYDAMQKEVVGGGWTERNFIR